MKYQRLTSDLFRSSTFSRNELDLFTTDFIKRYKAKASNLIPAEEFTLLEATYLKFKTGLGKLATEGALQKGTTLSRQDAFDEALDFIRRYEGLIKAKFGKPSEGYLAFYPQGLTEYNDAKVEGLSNLLVRYVSAANKYTRIVGADFVTEVTALQKNYVDARETQGTGIATNKSSQSNIRDSRNELTMQLTKVVLQIAAASVENADQFNSFFNFGLLEVDNDNPTREEEIPPTV